MKSYSIVGFTRKNKTKVLNDDGIMIFDKVLTNGIFSLDNTTFKLSLAVCDGVTGEKNGFIASQTTLQNLAQSDIDSVEYLYRVLNAINKKIVEFRTLNNSGNTSTTCVGVVELEDNLLFYSIGDSRAYKYSYNQLVKITTDDTLVQEMYDRGEIEYNEIFTHKHRNVITNYIGKDTENIEIEFIEDNDVNSGDLYLLCSDGLTDFVSEDDIKNILDNSNNINNSLSTLIDKTYGNKCSDDCSIIIFQVL